MFLKISQISQEKETLTQMFFCKICKIFKNTFLTEHLRQLLLIKVVAAVVELPEDVPAIDVVVGSK